MGFFATASGKISYANPNNQKPHHGCDNLWWRISNMAGAGGTPCLKHALTISFQPVTVQWICESGSKNI